MKLLSKKMVEIYRYESDLEAKDHQKKMIENGWRISDHNKYFTTTPFVRYTKEVMGHEKVY